MGEAPGGDAVVIFLRMIEAAVLQTHVVDAVHDHLAAEFVGEMRRALVDVVVGHVVVHGIVIGRVVVNGIVIGECIVIRRIVIVQLVVVAGVIVSRARIIIDRSVIVVIVIVAGASNHDEQQEYRKKDRPGVHHLFSIHLPPALIWP